MTDSAQQCPACGQSNRCALADPRTADQPCWCFSLTIDPEVIAALPAAQRGVACLCQRCAENLAPVTLAPTS
jgi:hypothetical protein